MFETMHYTVSHLDGDYAYLQNLTLVEEPLKCVARALLPPSTNEGTNLTYECLEYRLTEAE